MRGDTSDPTMSGLSLRQDALPGIRPLYADLLYNFSGVDSFYAHPPSLAAAERAAEGIRLDPAHRSRLVDELRRQNEGGGAATLRNLDCLADPRTVVVATGQQVGMFGGPAFSLYKALTAVRCARELTRQGRPAVPIFWLATEDHDLEEVNHAWTFGASGEPRRIEAATRGRPGAAVGKVEVTDFRLDEFHDFCAGLPCGEEARALARETHGSARGFGDAFLALYSRLLEPYGMIFLCPMQPGIRQLAAPLLRQVIRRAPALTDALLQRGLKLQAAGYHQQVHVQDSTSLVFLFEDGARVTLKRKNGLYAAKANAYRPEDLLARLDEAPLDISPSALLRPVMQDYLLPTAALVAGPSEAAYLGQASVLYMDLLGRMPAVLPRASFTLLDDASRRLLERYRLAVADCLVPRRELDASVAAALVPPPLEDTLRARRADIGRALGQSAEALEDFDPTLAASFRHSSRKIEYQLDKLRSKVLREALRRSDIARRHAARLADALFPNEHLQERLYGVLPMLAKFGWPLIERVESAIEPGSGDHRILAI